MKFMFNECIKIKYIRGMNLFNTSNVRDMSGMFQKCFEINNLDLSNFDTSNVIYMRYMFSECNNLKEIKGIENFITNNVIDMSGMFQKCYKLESLNLSNFNILNVTNMEYIFSDCYLLKKIKGIESFMINTNTDMKVMFQNCDKLESIHFSRFKDRIITKKDIDTFFNIIK